MKTPLEIISNFFDYSNIFNIIIQFTVLFTILKYFQQRRSPYELNIPSTLFQFAFILGIIVIFWYFCLYETKKTSITPEQFQKANQQYHQNDQTLSQKQANLQQMKQQTYKEEEKWQVVKQKAVDQLAPIKNEIRLTEKDKIRLEKEKIEKQIALQKEKNAKALKEKELQAEERKLKEKEEEEKDQELALKQAKTDKQRERIRQKLSDLRDEKQQIIEKINRIENAIERIERNIRTFDIAIARIERLQQAADERMNRLNKAAEPFRKHIAWVDERIAEIVNIRKNITKRLDEIQIQRKKFKQKQEEILILYQKFQEYKSNQPDDIVSCVEDTAKWCGRTFWKFCRFSAATIVSAIVDEDLATREEEELMKEFANDKPKMITKEGFDNINQAMQNYINEINVEEQQLQQRLTDSSFDKLKNEVILRESDLQKKLSESQTAHETNINEINRRNALGELDFINTLQQNKSQFEKEREQTKQLPSEKNKKERAIGELNTINENIEIYEDELKNTYPNENKINDKILNKRGINITFTKHHDPNTNTKK